MSAVESDRYHPRRPPLGRWLLGQHNRADQIGQLAQAARHDAGFPLDGNYAAISARLNQLGADGDMHVALEEAATDWSCW